MNITEIIGLTIIEIRYVYTYQNEYNMQEFFAYLKLSNGFVIEIPQYLDSEIRESTELNNVFTNAKKPDKNCKKRIENQKITDIHFCFYKHETDEESKAYLELENGIYITEENRGPMGLTTVDLETLTKPEFEKLKMELEEGFEIKSFVKDISNVC